MALRDQPYFPLYVQDFMTDEKLAECSAASTGVYIRIMCLMHKSESYGRIILKAKYKQSKSPVSNFSNMLVRHFPFEINVIESALKDLIENGVIQLEGDTLSQKRMLKDGGISEKRAKAGSKGGKSVKNSHTRKLYNEPGFLYIIEDIESKDVYKIGISKKPATRLIQLSNKLNKKLKLVFTIETDDMGLLEDNVLNAFNEFRDGEWVVGVDLSEMINVVNEQNSSKSKANSEYEYENENENDFLEKEKGGVGENEKTFYLIPQMLSMFKNYQPDYPDDEDRDFVALGEIVRFIEKQEKIPKGQASENEAKNKILDSWRIISEFIAKESFFRNYSLAQVSKHIQSIVQKLKNGKQGNSNNGQKVDLRSAFAKLSQMPN